MLAEPDPLARYSPRPRPRPTLSPDLTPLSDSLYETLEVDGGRERLASDLGVSVQSLTARRVGCSARSWATSWPMRRAVGERICGIRYRVADGRKWSERGGREGLFFQEKINSRPPILLLPEGAPDIATALTLGLLAIGRPSARSGVDLCIDAVRLLEPTAVIVCADADAHGAGQQGAADLARRLVGQTEAQVYSWTAPAACKDLRGYVVAGGAAESLVGGLGVARVAI